MAHPSSILLRLAAPVHALAAWLTPRPAVRPLASVSPAPSFPPAARPAGPRRPLRPVRVVRVVDGAAGNRPVRMLLSGRLSDVCAELDRLAAQEAARLSMGSAHAQ